MTTSSPALTAQTIVEVSVLNTKHHYFDYLADDILPLVGARVWVPFRNTQRVGLVVGHRLGETPTRLLKTITSVLDSTPLIPPELMHLCTFIRDYYHATSSQVFALALPKLYRQGRAIVAVNSDLYKTAANGEPELPLVLNPEQQHALDSILQSLQSYHCSLLHGVTGSGKTEVYLQLVAKVLQLNRQVLILVPEIGLTPQLLTRFRARFNIPIGVMHSHLTDTERLHTWQAARDNRIQIVIGTRTALFTPMPELGLIIIDEEHDASFKQMEGVRYSARDSALVRAHSHQIPIVLGSATPSLETLHNCLTQKYTQLHLTQKALNQLPHCVQLVDIRNQTLAHGLAKTTQEVIAKTLANKQQVLIFINRRGFAPVLLCHECGWIADCHACDSHLTLHRKNHTLLCHHCGQKQAMPAHCTLCQSTDLVPVGAGTQRIQQGLSRQYPNVPLLRIDRDHIKTTEALQTALNLIHKGTPQLIIGTQMLAKGHHFPNLGLVVILDTDAGFYNQDFRALERLGQLIVQVSGRTGREQTQGQVLIQTHLPHHPLLNQLIREGYHAFSETLRQLRCQANWPPFSFLALIRAQGKNPEDLIAFLNDLKQGVNASLTTALGPAPAPMARKAGKYQFQLLLRAASRNALNSTLLALHSQLANKPHKHAIRWSIDRDPIDLT